MTSTQQIQQYVAQYNMDHFLNDDLLSHLKLFRFPAYSNIFFAQDEQHVLYFLVEGQLQCSHYHLNGKLAVIALSTPFAAIGDLEILSDARVTSNVKATQDTIMLGISRSVVHRYGAEDPRFLRFLLDQLREKVFASNSLHVNQVLPVINRLAIYILTQSRNGERQEVSLPSKEEFASLLGITPRHLNRVLKQLIEAGSISADYPRVRILDCQALQDL